MGEPWRMAGCECPSEAKARERCNRQWTRCNERLRYLRPSAQPADAPPKPESGR